MSSGIYSALSGAMSRMNLMDGLTDNLANLKTVGFKKSQGAFASVLNQAQVAGESRSFAYAQLRNGITDFSQGPLSRTGVPLHLAIDGEGFFKVRDATGNTYFTRQGSFSLDQGNNLVTPDGHKVLDAGGQPVVLTSSEVSIDEGGIATLDDGSTRQIPLYALPDTAVLERQGGGLFLAPPGATAVPVASPRLIQGHLEESNVEVMQEMARMLDAMRTFEACQKMMKTYDSLAAKAAELGSVG